MFVQSYLAWEAAALFICLALFVWAVDVSEHVFTIRSLLISPVLI